MPAPAPPPTTQIVSTMDAMAFDTDSQDFDRVQWARCQARAERYEEEVELTVEEMGRTLRYFEWKRDWWLSLAPGHDKSDYPPDVQNGLRAYARRQSHLYDELITLFVGHWRAYLSSHSLGSSWLDKYSSRVGLIPVRPSRGHRKVDVGSAPGTVNVPASSELHADPKPCTDARLNSGSDDDSEGDEKGADAEGDMEGFIDAEDMFADD